MRRARLVVGLALSLGLGVPVARAALGLNGQRSPEESAQSVPEAADERVLVETAAAARGPSASLRAYGSTQAQARATLSFSVGGKLVDRPIDVGDSVEKGQVLARLDPAPFEHNVSLARAAAKEVEHRLIQSQRDQRRAQQLLEKHVVSRSEFEPVESEERALSARQEQASVRLAEALRAQRDAVLRAPYAGVIRAVHRRADEYAGAGVPVLELAGGGGLEIKVHVAEAARQQISRQTRVTVELPLVGRSGLAAEISALGDAGEQSGGLYPILVRLQSEGLSPGMSAEVVFEGAPGHGVSVPLEAVINRSGRLPYVFRVTGAPGRTIAERIPVRLIDLRGTVMMVESATGVELQAGDQVVTAGHARLGLATPVALRESDRSETQR